MNSEESKKPFDHKKYNEDYFNKHRDDKIECPDCKKVYSIFNKSHHKNSVYHKKITEYLKENKMII